VLPAILALIEHALAAFHSRTGTVEATCRARVALQPVPQEQEQILPSEPIAQHQLTVPVVPALLDPHSTPAQVCTAVLAHQHAQPRTVNWLLAMSMPTELVLPALLDRISMMAPVSLVSPA